MFPCSGVAGVGAAVQSVQAAAEQGLSVAMTKMQASLCFINAWIWDRAASRGSIFHPGLSAFVSRSCPGSSKAPQSQSLTFLRTRRRTQRRSSGKSTQTLQPTSQRLVVMQQQGLATSVGSGQCSRDTKIQVTSLAVPPDHTTKMPGAYAPFLSPFILYYFYPSFLPTCINYSIDVCLICYRHFLGQQLYNPSLNRHVLQEVGYQQPVGPFRCYHQDQSTVGGLTAEDIEKTSQSKRADSKPHKQMVIPRSRNNSWHSSSCKHRFYSSGLNFLTVKTVSSLCVLRSWVKEPERGRCLWPGSADWPTLEVGIRYWV